MEADLLPNPDSDCNLNASLQSSGESDPYSIELTAKEFDLLEYLMRHPNHVVTRDQILDSVWGYASFVSSNVTEVYIRYLRIKLEAYGAKRLIHTVRGVGYVLRIQQQQNLTPFSRLDQYQYSHVKKIADSIQAS